MSDAAAAQVAQEDLWDDLLRDEYETERARADAADLLRDQARAAADRFWEVLFVARRALDRYHQRGASTVKKHRAEVDAFRAIERAADAAFQDYAWTYLMACPEVVEDESEDEPATLFDEGDSGDSWVQVLARRDADLDRWLKRRGQGGRPRGRVYSRKEFRSKVEACFDDYHRDLHRSPTQAELLSVLKLSSTSTLNDYVHDYYDGRSWRELQMMLSFPRVFRKRSA